MCSWCSALKLDEKMAGFYYGMDGGGGGVLLQNLANRNIFDNIYINTIYNFSLLKMIKKLYCWFFYPLLRINRMLDYPCSFESTKPFNMAASLGLGQYEIGVVENLVFGNRILGDHWIIH